MCEEDISAFDPSMNNENLSKCLQTLKEFYRDLRKKVSPLSFTALVIELFLSVR